MRPQGALVIFGFNKRGLKGLVLFLLLMVLAFDAFSDSSLKSTLEHPLPCQHNFKLKNTGFLLGFHRHF
jgi:hypothetical protein